MSNIKVYNLDALSDSVQFGKTGGFASYTLLNNSFVFRQSDNTSTALVSAAGFTAVTGDITVLDATKKLGIIDSTISRDSNSVLRFDGSSAVIIPVGSNAARPTGKVGMIRVNTESTPFLETYNGLAWQNISAAVPGGSDTQIQYNASGSLGGSSRYTITFSEVQSSTTLKLGDPSSFSAASSTAYIDGQSSADSKQGTTINLRGGDNSGTGSAGSAVISGGYAIAAGSYAGNVVLIGGESSVGNHGNVLIYTLNNSGGAGERLRIAGGTGAWGLNGANYGSSGQVLTSNGYNASPTWTTIAGTVKIPFGFNSDATTNLFVIPTDGVVISVTIIVSTAFDGVGATAQVGDAAVTDRLMESADSLLSQSGSYTVYPSYQYGIATQLTLTLNVAGSTIGSGIVAVTYE